MLKKVRLLIESLNQRDDKGAFILHSSNKLPAIVECHANRRSRYIGVFKNGKRWQTILSIKNRKKYCGTYKLETDAARMFDLISILNSSLDDGKKWISFRR